MPGALPRLARVALRRITAGEATAPARSTGLRGRSARVLKPFILCRIQFLSDMLQLR